MNCNHEGIGEPGCYVCDPDKGRVISALRAEVERLRLEVSPGWRGQHWQTRGELEAEVERLRMEKRDMERERGEVNEALRAELAEVEQLHGQLREVTALTGDLTPEVWTRLSDVQGYVRCGAPFPEVEQLRGLIEEVEYGSHTQDGDACPWCGVVEREQRYTCFANDPDHYDDCPAFSARGEVRR